LNEIIDALWVWLNSGKSNDLRTNAFSQAAKCMSHGINIFWIIWSQYIMQTQKPNLVEIQIPATLIRINPRGDIITTNIT